MIGLAISGPFTQGAASAAITHPDLERIHHGERQSVVISGHPRQSRTSLKSGRSEGSSRMH
jgi:hypothetical protein